MHVLLDREGLNSLISNLLCQWLNKFKNDDEASVGLIIMVCRLPCV